MAIGAKLLDRLLKRQIQIGRLDLTYPDGGKIIYGQRTAVPVRAQIKDARWIGRILRNPELRVGEAYMVDNQAIVIPETIDAIRALTGTIKDGPESIAKTDAALDIGLAAIGARLAAQGNR